MTTIPSYNKKTAKQKITPELLRQIRDLCGSHTKEEISVITGRSVDSILKICSRQGFSLRLKHNSQNQD